MVDRADHRRQDTFQNVSGRSQEPGSEERMDQRAECIPGSGWRYWFTNMTMTIMSAASEVSSLTDPDMETLAKAISSGSLRGARGNSGVILSQLLRGFTKGN